MPSYVELHWSGDPDAMGGRRARRGFTYQAFVPDPIAELDPALPTAVVDELYQAAEALAALSRFAHARRAAKSCPTRAIMLTQQ